MATVDLRELAARVTDYVARVRSGETIVVTENEEPVALISPVIEPKHGEPTSDTEKLRRMAARGEIRWSGGKPTGLPPGKAIKMRGDRTMADLVIEERNQERNDR